MTRRRVLLVCGLSGWGIALAAGPIHTLESVPPAVGAVAIGESFSNQIRVRTASDLQLEADYLPHAGDVMDGGVEVLGSAWTEQDSGNEKVYDIHITYQLFRGTRVPEQVPIPALTLHFLAGNRSEEATVSAWEIQLAPLIPGQQADADVQVRGAADVLPYPLTDNLTWTAACFLALVATGLWGTWILALPPFRYRRRPPFEQAWHELQRLSRRGRSATTEQQAYRLVHGALNQSAGYVVFADRLDQYMAEHPLFKPLQPRFEQFFAGSWRTFFGIHATGQELSADAPRDASGNGAAWLIDLSRAAMELERGQP